MDSAFERASKSILAVMGQDALFRGVTPTKINIEYAVQVAGIDANESDLVVERDIATVDLSLAPRIDDTFTMVGGRSAGKTFSLERRLQTTGYNNRYVILEA